MRGKHNREAIQPSHVTGENPHHLKVRLSKLNVVSQLLTALANALNNRQKSAEPAPPCLSAVPDQLHLPGHWIAAIGFQESRSQLVRWVPAPAFARRPEYDGSASSACQVGHQRVRTMVKLIATTSPKTSTATANHRTLIRLTSKRLINWVF